MKKLYKYVAALGIMCMISTPVYAVLVGEEDGTPSHTANSCWALKVANGNLTPNSDGTCSLADQTGGEAGNHALDSSTHTNVNNISEAKGQLLVQGGVNWDALPLGVEGYVLRVVNANTLGVNWEDLSAIETDPTVDTSAEIQAIIGAGVYEPSGVTVADLTDATANGRSLISSTNYASMRGLLDLEAGTDFYSISAADTLLAAKLALSGGTLTGELVADETGIEGQPTDALTDCSTFSATGGGIFYDDSEGQWKKCEDNVLSDLDTGSSITATDTHVLFSDGANNPAGDAGFTYNKTTDSATLVGDLTVATEVYDATGWNGDNTVPTKDAVRDKIEALSAGSGTTEMILDVHSAKIGGALVLDGDVTQGAQIEGGAGAWKLLFDATTDEGALWQRVVPENFASIGTLEVSFSMASGEANEVQFEGEVMCYTPGTDTADIDTPSFATLGEGTATTVSATAGEAYTQSITLTDDSCAIGDIIFLKLSTDSDDATNDDATGDREVETVRWNYA